MIRHAYWPLLLAVCAALAPQKPLFGQTPSSPPAAEPAKVALNKGLATRADNLMLRLKAGEPPRNLVPEAERLLDLSIAYAQPTRDASAIVRVTSIHRLLSALADLKTVPEGVPAVLADNPNLAREIALSLANEDKPERVFALLSRLAKGRPELVGDGSKLSAVIAAICLVHDDPPAHPVLPRTPAPIRGGPDPAAKPLVMPAATPVDPLLLLDALAASRRQSIYPLESMPVALLVHVVDAHATPQDRTWARGTYAGNRAPGMLYDSITYDTAHFKYNQPKKIFREKAYSLENIKRVGGVCVEQAYFASEVGKALGVPSVFVTVRGASIGHAYVGYLKQQGGSVVWDFDEGRGDEYEDLRGNVLHPQTGKVVDTGSVALTATLARDKPEDRALAAALTIMAARVGTLAGGGTEYPPAAPDDLKHAASAKFRPASAETQLELVKAAVGTAPAHEPAWRLAGSMAQLGQLSSTQRGEWCKAAITLCARSAPDFTFDVLSSMITPSGADEQDRQWDWASKQFNTRPDLVAECHMSAARAWEQAGTPAKAYAEYQEVIRRFPNDGTAIVSALAKSESLLKDAAKPQTILDLYQDAFRRISKPSRTSTEFVTVSNYYRVGFRLAELLRAAGRTGEANQIMDQIGAAALATGGQRP